MKLLTGKRMEAVKLSNIAALCAHGAVLSQRKWCSAAQGAECGAVCFDCQLQFPIEELCSNMLSFLWKGNDLLPNSSGN